MLRAPCAQGAKTGQMMDASCARAKCNSLTGFAGGRGGGSVADGIRGEAGRGAS